MNACGSLYSEREAKLSCAPIQVGLLQRTAINPSSAHEIPPTVHEVLRSPGQGLDAATRAFMEPRFGHDFSQVRVHTDEQAADTAGKLDARAFAVGNHIVFGEHQHKPDNDLGRRVLAHELTHLVQTGMSVSSPLSHLSLSRANDPSEEEAERVAHDVVSPAPNRSPINSYSPDTIRRILVTPLGPGGGYGGLLDRDRRRTFAPSTRVFALTFDDGPHTEVLGTGKNRTELVLDTLKNKGIKAGFFVQTGMSYRGGSTIGQALIKRMNDEGHSIGIHTGGTIEHELHPEAQKAGRLETELESAKKFIKQTTSSEEEEGIEPTFVRPPKGLVRPKTGSEAERKTIGQAVQATYKKVGLTNLLWDIDGDLGRELSLDELKDRVTSGLLEVQKNDWRSKTASSHIVILYHDIKKNTAENIGTLINHIASTTRTISGGSDDATFAPP